jgi:PII-like signaling protein
MSDLLKFTAYFAERERCGQRFLAEVLLDLFATPAISASVMLRGIASFGPHHFVRSDESLTLSEDPPVMITAIGDPAAVTAIVDDVTAITARGLITLERAQRGYTPVPGERDGVKLTLYLSRRQRINGVAAHRAAVSVFHRAGFAGAAVFLGVDGSIAGRRRRARFFSGNADVPVLVVAVGDVSAATAATRQLATVLPDPLLTAERVRICKRDGRVLAEPHPLPTTDAAGLNIFEMLTVYTAADSRHDGAPIHRALVRRLQETRQVNGATVLRGVWGFHGDHAPRGDTLFALGRGVPVATVIVDTPASIARSFALVDELTGDFGLVTSERVPAMLALAHGQRHGGTRLAWD